MLTHDQYIDIAIENLKNSYSPYSNFPVSAIVVTNSGEIFKGVNIENASFGATVCAERTAIFSSIANGFNKNEIKKIYVVANTKRPVPPCCLCRQVMLEFFDKNTEIILTNLNKDLKIMDIDELVPYPFLEEDMNE